MPFAEYYNTLVCVSQIDLSLNTQRCGKGHSAETKQLSRHQAQLCSNQVRLRRNKAEIFRHQVRLQWLQIHTTPCAAARKQKILRSNHTPPKKAHTSLKKQGRTLRAPSTSPRVINFYAKQNISFKVSFQLRKVSVKIYQYSLNAALILFSTSTCRPSNNVT